MRTYTTTICSMISIVALATITGIWWLHTAQPTIIRARTVVEPFVIGQQDYTEPTRSSRTLNHKLNTLLAQENGSWSVIVRDLSSGKELVSISPEQPYHAASLMKIITALTVFEKVEAGTFHLTQSIGNTTLRGALRSMINQSDNTAWETLNVMSGFITMQNTAETLGMTSTNVHTNHTTPADMARLLTSLYRGAVLSSSHQSLLLSWMQETETEDRIPAGTYPQTTVMHKAGTLDGFIHDVGIIEGEKPILLVVMGSDTTREEGTATIKKVTAHTVRHLTDESSP